MENTNTNTNTKKKMMMMKKKTPPTTTFKKVQIVYYLSRNGQLEHPHFMELSHLPHHPLRLKDVMERLMLLRGKGMPSLYSWSCKRSYKNGYVWNDLGENDMVYPTESETENRGSSAEYILKGSEILLLQPPLLPSSSSATTTTPDKKIQQHDVIQSSVTAEGVTSLYPKRTTQQTKRHPEPQEAEVLYREEEEEEEENYNDDDDEYEEDDDDEKQMVNKSSKPTPTTTELTQYRPNSVPKSPPPLSNHSLLSRNSLLLQLIACGGGSAAVRGRITSASPGNDNVNKLRKGAICNRAAAAAAAATATAIEMEEKMIIRCMSENPRFGNLQAEEKEYFSGSIVDSMISKEEERVRSVESAQLKKSSSYNEQRSLKSGLGEEEVKELQKGGSDDMKKREREKVGKCISMRMMRSYCITKQPNNNNK